MSVSTRTRFEILKRDGFRCRYCGSTPLAGPLHVDHVVPSSKGGTDDPENLLTACSTCNLGKSNVKLDESRLRKTMSADDLREQTEQITAYMEACKDVTKVRNDFRRFIAGRWKDAVGEDRLSDAFVTRLVRVVETVGYQECNSAIEIVSSKEMHGVTAQKYFNGVIRKRFGRSDMSAADVTVEPPPHVGEEPPARSLDPDIRPVGSVSVPVTVIRDRLLPDHAFRVAAALWWEADPDGVCRASYEDLARSAGKGSAQAVKRGVRALEERGHVHRRRDGAAWVVDLRGVQSGA